jgi:hypothetical protein
VKTFKFLHFFETFNCTFWELLMNFRLIALASCVALGSIALGDKAQAQFIDVPFSGTVGNVCTFFAPIDGVLARPGALNAVEASGGVTGFSTGTAGSLALNCTAGGTLTVNAPVSIFVPGAFSPAIRQAVVQLNSSAIYTSANSGANFDTGGWAKPTTPMVVPPGLQTLNVAMIAGTNAAATPPTGRYVYSVRLSAISN